MWRVVAITRSGRRVVLFEDEEERGARMEHETFTRVWQQRRKRDGGSQFVGLGGREVKLWLIEAIEVEEV
jgi:hypothetical protein